MQQETGGTGQGHRQVSMSRVSKGVFDVTNVRGGTIRIGGGDNTDFTPVELLLTAIAGCSAVDVDFITTKRAQPTRFAVTSEGEKIRDELGNHLEALRVLFDVAFEDTPEGAEATARVPRAIEQSHHRLCTVTRTVEIGTPVETRQREPGDPAGDHPA